MSDKPKLAVVEDNPDNRMLLEAMLEDDYALTQYPNGKDALAGLKDDRPALVLLDISLPQMDGTQVLERMRSSETLASIPVIALTAHAMEGDREKYLAMGFDAYVAKPIVDEQILFDAIERLIARRPSSLEDKRARVRQRYLGKIPGKISALQQLRDDVNAGRIDDDARKQIRDWAHNLRGSGASYGFPAITEVASKVDAQTDEGLAERLGELIRILNETVAGSKV